MSTLRTQTSLHRPASTQHAWPVATERRRRSWRFATKDADILASFRLNPVQTLPQIHRLLERGKTYDVIKRRVQALREMGYLTRLCQPTESAETINAGSRMHFLTARGWAWLDSDDRARPPVDFNVATLPPRATGVRVEIKTNKNARHDLKLTDLFLALRQACTRSRWEFRAWERLPVYAHDRGGGVKVTPDAFFIISSPEVDRAAHFVEVENSDPSVRQGVQSITEKCDRYLAYAASAAFERRWNIPTFRVLFVMRTETMATRQCRRLREAGGAYDSRRWLFTWDDALPDIDGRVFVTPRGGDSRFSLTD